MIVIILLLGYYTRILLDLRVGTLLEEEEEEGRIFIDCLVNPFSLSFSHFIHSLSCVLTTFH